MHFTYRNGEKIHATNNMNIRAKIQIKNIHIIRTFWFTSFLGRRDFSYICSTTLKYGRVVDCRLTKSVQGEKCCWRISLLYNLLYQAWWEAVVVVERWSASCKSCLPFYFGICGAFPTSTPHRPRLGVVWF